LEKTIDLAAVFIISVSWVMFLTLVDLSIGDGEVVAMAGKCSQRKRSLVIAEDDEDDREFYEAALTESAKCVDFVFVGNGVELIEYLRAHESLPDLIFLDLNMPLMDGREALKVIRSHPKFKDIPVVCITTSSNKDDRSLCFGHGAGFFTKPARISEFSALVQSQVRKS
jgi:CheY-like chemotaxis protein